MSMTNYEHEKRLAKLSTDRFFLLDAQVKPTALSFGVSGSTGNIYRVEINRQTRRFTCDCPDATTHAKNYGVECKHCLFVAHRALRSSLPNEHFTRNKRYIPSNLLQTWVSKAEQLQSMLSTGDAASQQLKTEDGQEIVNLDLAQRYQALQQGKSITENKSSSTSSSTSSIPEELPPGVVLTCDFRGRGADEECPICFENIIDLVKGGKRELVSCLVCTRAIHKDCCEQWISTAHNDTCVYCRSKLAYATYVHEGGANAKKRKKVVVATSLGGYVNVANL